MIFPIHHHSLRWGSPRENHGLRLLSQILITYLNALPTVRPMGGPDRRQAELWHDIDSYLTKRRRTKGFLSTISGIRPASSISSKTKRAPSLFGSGFGISECAREYWESIKQSIKDTVQKDLAYRNQPGGTTMKPSQEFIDFEEGGLTVVPIPEEIESPAPLKSRETAAQPSGAPAFAASASGPAPTSASPAAPLTGTACPQASLPASQRQGFFSRWFSKKQAGKQEQMLDEDFLLTAAQVNPSYSLDIEKELKEDFKELAKLYLKTLERMNKDQLSQFRSTPEFDRLKELLRKYNVIK